MQDVSAYPRCPRVYVRDGKKIQCSRPQSPGGNKWCLACRAEYRRDYEETKVEMAKNKGFHEGVRVMKEILAQEFERLGSGSFEGYEIAALIRQAPGPRSDDQIPTVMVSVDPVGT